MPAATGFTVLKLLVVHLWGCFVVSVGTVGFTLAALLSIPLLPLLFFFKYFLILLAWVVALPLFRLGQFLRRHASA